MTVSYQYEVASSTSGGFTRLLFMWRGSLYKLIYRELLLFLAAFGLLSALYRNAFNTDQRKIFEKMVMYCDTFINLIPLSFVLGFYVAYVAGRWWQQYMAIPWPDKMMHSIALYVSGDGEHGRMVRRTLMRYLNLTLILVLRSISSAVKRRFPTLQHVVDSGFMTDVELDMYQKVPSGEFNTYWIPCTWFISLLKDCRRNNRIEDSQGLHIIMEEFNEFRSKCGLLWSYDWVSIPLVYTQVVTIATYSFFLAALVGRQYVDAAKKPLQMEIDIYLPVFTILQFFFFMGLLKVAEQLINPFGDDDEDFELNWLIDRHTKVSYLGVDILMASAPPLVKDMYFDQTDIILPYTEASVGSKKRTYRGSVHNMAVPEDKQTMYLPEICEEDEDRTPTPRSSLSNLQSAPHFRFSEPAGLPTAAAAAAAVAAATAAAPSAAAGTWRLLPPTNQTFYKTNEMGSELQTRGTSGEPVEICVDTASLSQEQENLERVEKKSEPHAEKSYRPLCRAESVPTKPVNSTEKSRLCWPSSSTLDHSYASFHNSEQSLDGQSWHYSSSHGDTITSRLVDPEYGHHHVYSASASGNKSMNKTGEGGVGSSGECGTYNSAGIFRGASNVSSCSNAGRSGDRDGCGSDSGGIGGDEGGEVNGHRYIIGNSLGHYKPTTASEMTYNVVSKESFDSQNAGVHKDPWKLPGDESDYVYFEKDFGSRYFSKVKSCPKLILVKRQTSTTNGKKKGVRWKPMMHSSAWREGASQRRLTVGVLPSVSDLTGMKSSQNIEDIDMIKKCRVLRQCKLCKKQGEFGETLFVTTSSADSEKFVSEIGESASDLSLLQPYCSFHQGQRKSEGNKGNILPTHKLVVGAENLTNRPSSFEERRATLSTLTLTGSEWEAHRWQSKSFWERGFFKKIKNMCGYKGIKVVPVTLKRKESKLKSKSLSQSLPNIAFPYFYSGESLVNIKTEMAYNKQLMPTVCVSDMTPTGSDDSTCFVSVVDMQEEEGSRTQVSKLASVLDDSKVSKVSLDVSTNETSNSSVSVSYASCEFFNASSKDTSSQSTDWSRDSTAETRTPTYPERVLKEDNVCAITALEEVVIDCKKESSQTEELKEHSVL